MTLVERNGFLEEPGVLMRIGVARDDGSPLVTPIWFLYQEDSVYFTPRAQSDWFQSLRRDPRICLCIDEQALPYRKVVVEGSAELLHDLG
ncbi:MAG: pyridoxamine 5'-phosphate oxidase family protein, partial [Pseudomonadota bacterium]|nr:pyridoxamine 5'-phosphate oxidase family protein [Pseudomonadota bacterium]